MGRAQHTAALATRCGLTYSFFHVVTHKYGTSGHLRRKTWNEIADQNILVVLIKLSARNSQGDTTILIAFGVLSVHYQGKGFSDLRLPRYY